MPYPRAHLYYCKSDPQKFDKVYEEVGSASGFEITYNSNFNIMNPIFRFSKNITSLNFNYIYVDTLQRNYYVYKEPVYKEGFWEVEAHIDVIESWKNSIKNIGGILRRAGNKYVNQYLVDEKFKAYQAPAIRTITIPPADPDNCFSEDITEFIMCVVGNQAEVEPGGNSDQEVP